MESNFKLYFRCLPFETEMLPLGMEKVAEILLVDKKEQNMRLMSLVLE